MLVCNARMRACRRQVARWRTGRCEICRGAWCGARAAGSSRQQADKRRPCPARSWLQFESCGLLALTRAWLLLNRAGKEAGAEDGWALSMSATGHPVTTITHRNVDVTVSGRSPGLRGGCGVATLVSRYLPMRHSTVVLHRSTLAYRCGGSAGVAESCLRFMRTGFPFHPKDRLWDTLKRGAL